MKRLSDEEWLAQARSRYAEEGQSWDIAPDFSLAPLVAVPPTAAATALACPYCSSPSALQVFARHDVVTQDPLLYCSRCYGFWAAGDSLRLGACDPGQDHPALFAVPAPARCRACGGRLAGDGACRSCKQPLPPLFCPACRKPMDRFKDGPVTLDRCIPCNGVWFDIGEIALKYNLRPPLGLAAHLVDEDGEFPEEPSAWPVLINLGLRFLTPFL